MATTVGVIGLGNMGSAFATHLVRAGFTVVGFDVDETRRQVLRDAGGTAVESAAEVGARTELVVTSLASGQALLDTAAALGAGSGVVADTSTLGLPTKLEAREAFACQGRELLDCPVSGTGSQARERDVAVYVSGELAAYERVARVIDAFARSHRYVGEFGAGTKLKLVANLLVAVHNVAAAEALVLARKAGLDPATTLDALLDGAGASRMLAVRGPTMLARSWDEPSADLAIFRKDVSLIRALAESLDCPTPLLGAAAQVYATALAHGREREDAAAVYAALAEAAALDD